MRVWNDTDPRLLNRKHLLAEHREVHALLNDDHNWGTNPEYVRFARLGPRGRSLLVLRHELLRVAMHVRYQRHTRDLHSTPVDEGELSPRAAGVLLAYERHCIEAPTNPYIIQHYFRSLMSYVNYPPCTLAGGATTPWHRDSIPASVYVRTGDAWQRSRFHHRADTTSSL